MTSMLLKMKTNMQKKKEIDEIVARYTQRFVELQRKRTTIVSNFLEVLKQKRLEEIRKSLS